MKNDTMTESVIRNVTLENDGSQYSYALIKKESRRVSSYGMPLYSVEIEFTDINGNTTSARAGDIFANIDKAIAFYDKMVKNLATPIDLAYVIEDEMV